MKWRALKRKDEQRDEYAVGLTTHTVCKVIIGGRVIFEAWREGNPPERLAGFSSETAFEEAKLCAETDAGASSSSLPSANHSAHGTAVREASQGRSSSSRSKAVTAEVHGASIGPKPLEIQ